MIDPSLPRKKKKVTLKASLQGIATAEKALIRLGFESKSNFAKSQLISRSTVTNFFLGEPIQLDSLKRICTALQLSWQEIVGMSVAEEQQVSSGIELKISNDTKEVGKMHKLRRKVTVVNPNSEKVTTVITLEGDLDSVDNWEIIQLLLRQHSGCSINIIDIESGSIRLTVEGSQADIQKLINKIRSGELTELNGLPIQNIEISTENLDTKKIDKWDLVKAIVDRRITDRNLRGADLSDADLSRSDLRGADLSRSDLSRSDLNLADLRGAYLHRAYLYRADLRGANLSGANLSNANLSDANLMFADVEKTIFGDNQGIAESMKLDLQQRGAIFEDAPGDRSSKIALK